MRILVTGAAGFLGSHFAEKYLNEGHEIIAVDNFFTGKKDNVKHLISNPDFDLVRHDITQPLLVEVDAIANFACPASPIHYQKYPVQTIQTSVIGVTNLLELAKRLDIKILQASTSEVYGDPQIPEQDESYWGNVNPIGIRSCYDEGKRVAETLMFDYHRQYGIKIKIARIFNTYGPRMALDDGRVVTNFIVQALRNEPITIYGDGSQTRSFGFVSDTIDGLAKLFDSPIQITGPINIGNPEEFTIRELAEEVLRLTNSNSQLIQKPLPMDDPLQRRPDIARARQNLKWEPKVQLEEGLKITIADIKTKIASITSTA
ncbi:MAG TPA: NAD-dependent dehydratase [Chitinophagaceae bacterium]|nr:NAD-dependent dehydratase [Chitinophagaceae bacterium]